MFEFLKKLFCDCEFYEEDMSKIPEKNEFECKCRKCGREVIILKDEYEHWIYKDKI